jgi:hypothetical protein
VPVVRLPTVLTPHGQGSRDSGRQRIGAAPGDFVFLFIFDFHSHTQRKNPLAVVEAFKRAFRPADAASLVIKCVNADSKPEDFARLTEEARGQRIAIHSGYWPGRQVRDLMAGCDAYISLHRAEGIGLTITDALALGKPVIATGWSGNMDFMNVSNSFPVRYRLVELAENVGPYQAGQVWAEPSVEDAAELMRFVFENRDEAQARGEAARHEMQTNYSETAVAERIRERLGAIALRRRLPAFREEVKNNYSRYLQLPERINRIADSLLPPAATVAVVSKGDELLVHLPGRTAWHFPQGQDGAYAGFYPADSAAAIEHLEGLRRKGAQFLLFPSTAFWWLEHYQDFRKHLETHYQALIRQDDTCLVFAL